LPKDLDRGIRLSGDFQHLKKAWMGGMLTYLEFLQKQNPISGQFVRFLNE
jgi:hypothetical protein